MALDHRPAVVQRHRSPRPNPDRRRGLANPATTASSPATSTTGFAYTPGTDPALANTDDQLHYLVTDTDGHVAQADHHHPHPRRRRHQPTTRRPRRRGANEHRHDGRACSRSATTSIPTATRSAWCSIHTPPTAPSSTSDPVHLHTQPRVLRHRTDHLHDPRQPRPHRQRTRHRVGRYRVHRPGDTRRHRWTTSTSTKAPPWPSRPADLLTNDSRPARPTPDRRRGLANPATTASSPATSPPGSPTPPAPTLHWSTPTTNSTTSSPTPTATSPKPTSPSASSPPATPTDHRSRCPTRPLQRDDGEHLRDRQRLRPRRRLVQRRCVNTPAHGTVINVGSGSSTHPTPGSPASNRSPTRSATATASPPTDLLTVVSTPLTVHRSQSRVVTRWRPADADHHLSAVDPDGFTAHVDVS